MQVQIKKLKQEIQERDEVIQKAYQIIEAQQEQILKFTKLNFDDSFSRISIKTNNYIQEYKEDLEKWIQVDNLIENMIEQQCQKQSGQIKNIQFQKIDELLIYWQDKYNETTSQFQNLNCQFEIQEYQKQEQHELMEYYVYENKELKKIINNLYSLNQQNTTQHLEQINQQINEFIIQIQFICKNLEHYIDKLKTYKSNQKDSEQLLQSQNLLDLQKQVTLLDLFKQKIIQQLNLSSFDQSDELIIRELKKSLKKENSQDQENIKDNSNLNQKMLYISSQFQQLFKEIQKIVEQQKQQFKIPTNIKTLIDILIQNNQLLLKELSESKDLTIKKINGLGSQFRMIKNETQIILQNI